jgi:hypothetical protein
MCNAVLFSYSYYAKDAFITEIEKALIPHLDAIKNRRTTRFLPMSENEARAVTEFVARHFGSQPFPLLHLNCCISDAFPSMFTSEAVAILLRFAPDVLDSDEFGEYLHEWKVSLLGKLIRTLADDGRWDIRELDGHIWFFPRFGQETAESPAPSQAS